MNIGCIVAAAFEKAATGKDFAGAKGKKGELHREWSQHFVACLARELRASYDDPNVVVMSKDLLKGDPDAIEQIRTQFGMQELLYDIAVFEYGKFAAGRGELLSFARRGLWFVESELAKDSRQALYDFNKLVLGRSTNKLFVGPQVAPIRRDAYLNVLKAAASGCDGNLYLALVPHPEAWQEDQMGPVEVLAWGDGDWQGNLGPIK